jgi:hypothetical protein
MPTDWRNWLERWDQQQERYRPHREDGIQALVSIVETRALRDRRPSLTWPAAAALSPHDSLHGCRGWTLSGLTVTRCCSASRESCSTPAQG